jgi:hypothetical protein
MEINLKWLPGFQMCSVMQLYLERLKFTKRQSNLIACIIFQVVFVSNAIKLLVNNNGSIDSTLINIDLITGYFIYDTINILTQDFSWLFLGHHILTLVMINIMKNLEMSNKIYYYNMICILGEITNPFLNIRHLLHGSKSKIRKINDVIILITYTVIRIIMFPIIFIQIFLNIQGNTAYTLLFMFSCLYIASIMWFRRIIYINREFLEKYLPYKHSLVN